MTGKRQHQRLEASPKSKGLIFDLDGTLIDDLDLHWQAWSNACRHFGAIADHQFFLSLTGKPVGEIAEILIDTYNIPTSPEEIVSLKEQFVYQHIDEVEVFPAVVGVVRANYGRLPMTVGTGSDRRRAQVMLAKAGIDGMFDALVCAEDVQNHKPAPDTFLRCARLMNVPPEDCQVFEDGQLGLDAARAANMIATDVRPYLNDI